MQTKRNIEQLVLPVNTTCFPHTILGLYSLSGKTQDLVKSRSRATRVPTLYSRAEI